MDIVRILRRFQIVFVLAIPVPGIARMPFQGVFGRLNRIFCRALLCLGGNNLLVTLRNIVFFFGRLLLFLSDFCDPQLFFLDRYVVL